VKRIKKKIIFPTHLLIHLQSMSIFHCLLSLHLYFISLIQDPCFQLNDTANQNLKLEIVAARTIATLAIQMRFLPAITKKLVGKIILLFKLDMSKIALLIARIMLQFNLQMDQCLMEIWNILPHLSKNVTVIVKIPIKINREIARKRIAIKELGIDRNR